MSFGPRTRLANTNRKAPALLANTAEAFWGLLVRISGPRHALWEARAAKSCPPESRDAATKPNPPGPADSVPKCARRPPLRSPPATQLDSPRLANRRERRAQAGGRGASPADRAAPGRREDGSGQASNKEGYVACSVGEAAGVRANNRGRDDGGKSCPKTIQAAPKDVRKEKSMGDRGVGATRRAIRGRPAVERKMENKLQDEMTVARLLAARRGDDRRFNWFSRSRCPDRSSGAEHRLGRVEAGGGGGGYPVDSTGTGKTLPCLLALKRGNL